MHTGTGRISRIMMRPMSLYESNESNGKVSLKAILKGEDIEGTSDLTLEGIAEAIVRGGWPASLDIEGTAKFRVAQEYVKSLLREELKL